MFMFIGYNKDIIVIIVIFVATPIYIITTQLLFYTLHMHTNYTV